MAKTELFVRRQKGGMFTVVNQDLTTGDIYFVDSGSARGADAAGYGQNPDWPFLTLAYAVTQCTANNGDRIYLMPGHAEEVAAAGAIDLDVAGVKVIGLGLGRNRPTFAFADDVDADIDVTANNVTFENLVFDMSGIDDLVAGLDVAGTDFTLKNSEIIMTVATRQAEEAIDIGNAADRTLIENCTIGAPDAGAEAAINIGAAAAVVGNVSIKNTVVRGDFTNAPIYSAAGAEHTNTQIENCTLVNANAGNHALEFADAATGQIINNKLVSDAIATALEPQACACFGNLYFDSDDSDVNGTPIPVGTATGGVSLNAIQAVTDNLPDSGALTGIDGKLDDIEADVQFFGDGQLVSKEITYDGSTSYAAFTVTGLVAVKVIGHQTTILTDHTDSTSVGTADSAAGLIAATQADALRNAGAGAVWVDASPALFEGSAFPAAMSVIGGNEDIAVVGTANITGGVVTLYCFWKPLSTGASVVPA